jgi:hypothetical protein
LSCGPPCGLEVLFPHLAGVVVEQVDRLPGLVCLSVRARGEEGICPRCGAGLSRVHSRYERRLADAAVGGQRMVIRLRVPRFFCDVPGCPASAFAERTVETQITSILNKLGLNFRTQISRWMADLNTPTLTSAEKRP